MIQNYIAQKTVMSCILKGLGDLGIKCRMLRSRLSLIHVVWSTYLPLPSPLIKLSVLEI